MKKVLILFGLIAVVFALCFNTEVSAEEASNDFLYDDLSEGETVVDFYRETVPDEELMDDNVPFHDFQGKESELVENINKGSEITPFAPRSKKWYAVSKSYTGHTYSGWKYAGASTLSGGVLTASHTKSVSNTFSGSLTVTEKVLSSYVGFDIGKSWSRTVSYSTHSYPSGKYRLEYRHVYKTYKVKQEQKYDRRGKASATKYVYPKKWVERQYRVVKF
ncbi:hypothetical protein HXA31_17395 [Salipaludibacillus agaradhaerens]|jgi:hypothetical protein|uniref:Uncharacterized protein n=1 Tax=Salipaludibacillus agaradhaerens TaxID=76935 RepID=A0A9Q4G0U5_SALAG|nr:hypothetical protein [Salipaludibacillus agaradhaerens]MCR6098253.1 hypothetical protein [Salipaludibacillus agaradhaerens]MCR6116117.1 hypothetical protein [Salipaludibacillus agaradhaerens]